MFPVEDFEYLVHASCRDELQCLNPKIFANNPLAVEKISISSLIFPEATNPSFISSFIFPNAYGNGAITVY